MSYEMRIEDAMGFVGFIGAETKQKGDELQFRYCPYCGNNASRDDEWKFGLNLKSGAYGGFRLSCGHKGHFVKMCKDFGYKLSFMEDMEFAQIPQPRNRIVPKEAAIAYLKGRGISKEIAEKYEITVSDKQPNVLIFPFYNEYGKIEFIKYRDMKYKKGKGKSKEWSAKDCKPILFGMKQCEDFDTLVITEGQIDSLSVAQAGIKNAVSVPLGALGFTWLPHCWDWIVKFNTIIVFGDREKGHMTLLDTLLQRLPNKIKAVRAEDYLGEKDANAILTSFGEEAIRECINNAKEPDMDYVIDLAEVQRKNDEDELKIKTGIMELDEVLKGGIRCGQLLMLTGKSGQGKSTLASQMLAEALNQNIRVFSYSGELSNEDFQECINLQLAGDENVVGKKNEFGKLDYSVPEDTEQRIKNWYRNRIYIYDNNRVGIKDRPKLPELIRQVIIRKGVQLVLVDNLMTAMEYVKSQNDLHLAQTNFVEEMKAIATQYHVAIIMIAHPRKPGTGEAKDKDLENDDIAGSSNITNLADIVVTYSRAKSDYDYDSVLQVTKNRKTGKLRKAKDSIHLLYSDKSKRIKEMRTLDKVYGWEKQPTLIENIDIPF